MESLKDPSDQIVTVDSDEASALVACVFCVALLSDCCCSFCVAWLCDVAKPPALPNESCMYPPSACACAAALLVCFASWAVLRRAKICSWKHAEIEPRLC